MGKPLEQMHGHVAYKCKFRGYYLRKKKKKITGIGNRGYFMVGECGRFFFTSCERRERTSERSERVSSATPRNE